MATLNDVNSVSIDATGGKVDIQQSIPKVHNGARHTVIRSSSSSSQPIVISAANNKVNTSPAEQVGGRKASDIIAAASRVQSREAVNIDEVVPSRKTEDPNIHKSPEEDIILGSKQDREAGKESMFEKYYNQKRKDMVDYMNWRSEKAAEEEEKKENEEKEESKDNIMNDDTSSIVNDSLILDEFDEEDNLDMNEENFEIENVDISDDTEEKIEATGEIELVNAVDEEEDNNYVESNEDTEEMEDNHRESEVTEESKEDQQEEVIKEEKKEISASDIELEDDIESNDILGGSSEDDSSKDDEEDDVVTDDQLDFDEKERRKRIKEMAVERFQPISKKLDISTFTIIKNPDPKSTFASDNKPETKARVSKWVLPTKQSVVMMKEFSGSELERLREYSEDGESLDQLNRRYHLIYDHIVSPKPQKFDQWLKTTCARDITHYYFAIFVACFKGAAFLPVSCQNENYTGPDGKVGRCDEYYLTEDTPIMDMVKFDTDEDKAKFMKLYKDEPNYNGVSSYATDIVPINNNYAIGFKDAVIYDFFETTSIRDPKIRSKYSQTLDIIPFVDCFYHIDMENHNLVAVKYKAYKDNANKTFRSKIETYNEILKTFSIDEFNIISSYVNNLGNKTDGIHYVIPATTCPKCGHEQPERATTGEELVFTRAQLSQLVNITLS